MLHSLWVEMTTHKCYQTAVQGNVMGLPLIVATMLDHFVVLGLFVPNPMQKGNGPKCST
jgi:hypothetical protein